MSQTAKAVQAQNKVFEELAEAENKNIKIASQNH